ncbi:sulfotransferase family protein [Microbacterium excoecariae]|uniref:sulfotransferase family protein n=1 Tax=Microbacterium excoecariae TaxID=2715210 RepID=UPI001408068B|nr:sulfotransferase [Microbacterium excoecariae]NHI18006.1 sulfotransferase [Microbacterium excoecariae]
MSRMMFIGGLQRSGTTLLGRLLASHPDVAGLTGTGTHEDEGQFVQDVYDDDHRLGRPDGGKRGRVNHWGFNPDSHLDESYEVAADDARARLDASWRTYWSKSGAQILVEKSPSNVLRTRFLQKVYPDSHFVIITRHPLIQALATRKWVEIRRRVGFDLEQLIEHWLVVMETFRGDSPALKNFTMIRYEDLVDSPQSVLNEVCRFAGLAEYDFDVSAIRRADDSYLEYIDQMRSRRRLISPLNPKGNIAHEAIRLVESLVVGATGGRSLHNIESQFEDRVSGFGYSFQDLLSAKTSA